jgi:Spy/CpxP family protein refolding chaperone
MSTGKRSNKGLIFLVVVLLLSNIGLLLYFLVWKKPAHKSGGGRGDFSIVEYMKKEIGFSEDQTKQFQQLHEQNRESLKQIGDSIRFYKNSLYALLKQEPVNDSAVSTAIEAVSQHQQKMELTMFRHFQRVRAICDPGQQVKLDSMLNRMNNRPSWYRRGGPPRTSIDSSKKS